MTHPNRVREPEARPSTGRFLAALRRIGATFAVVCAPATSQAIEFGPDGLFFINGFGEVTVTRANNQCPLVHPKSAGSRTNGCQFDPDRDRQRAWTDDVVPGRELSSREAVFSQVGLWLGAKYDLGQGFKIKGTLAQNWRDGRTDVPGFWREKNVELSHEQYGVLTVGHMISRTWMFADYPFGSNLGLSYAWASTGAGYRNLTQAIRLTSPVLDIANGNVVLEMTYDRGSNAFKIHEPRFIELWAHYGNESVSIDAMYQDTRNGTPSAFGASVFNGLFYDPAVESLLGGSGQSVGVVQVTYRMNPRIDLLGAVRRNRWSGAYAVVLVNGPPQQWNNMFNVDWGGTLNGVPNPGYSATSTDFALGLRYRLDEKWTLATGLAYLGKANTRNPLERGQSNSALVNTVVADYAFNENLLLSMYAGMIHYRKKGLSPLSMPSNSTINNIDSRTTKAGNWIGVGAKYTF